MTTDFKALDALSRNPIRIGHDSAGRHRRCTVCRERRRELVSRSTSTGARLLACVAVLLSQAAAVAQPAGAASAAPASSPSALPPPDSDDGTDWLPEGGRRAVVVLDRACFPEYPVEVLRRGVMGTSRLSFTIDGQGRLIDGRILPNDDGHHGSARKALDLAAYRALSTCRFKPGLDAQGRPATTRIVVSYTWRID